jgi:NTP pyrophosphatase (non-canonical NTP hydrolase)
MTIGISEFQEWVRHEYREGEYKGLEDQLVNLLVSQVGMLADAVVKERDDRVAETVPTVMFLVIAVADRSNIDVADALEETYALGG